MYRFLTSIALCAILCALPTDGKAPDKPLALADPFIFYHNGLYYAYGTGGSGGFDVYSSRNLGKWQLCPHKALSKDDSYGEKWFWAPEVYQNPDNGKFYLFYSAEEHICVAVSDSPEGPFRQDIQEPMFEEKAIDSSLFIDTDGKAYLYFVRFTGGNVIWCAELTDDWMHIHPETLKECISAELPWERKMARVAEGPTVLKKDGTYYLIYSANHFQSQDYGVGYATADSPEGGWVKNADPILCKPSNGLKGTGHGSVFKDRKGNMHYVFHSHKDEENVNPRILHIADITISDGHVVIDTASIFTPAVRR